MKIKLYGLKGRAISATAIVIAFLGSLEASGALNLLPQKYWWVAPVVTSSSALIAGFSERVQGGASKLKVRKAAAASDERKAVSG